MRVDARAPGSGAGQDDAHLTGALSQQARRGRSFCDDVSYGRAGHSHLQSARKHQADHDDGADQHADRDQPAFAVAHFINEGPAVDRTASPTDKRKEVLFYPTAPMGTSGFH